MKKKAVFVLILIAFLIIVYIRQDADDVPMLEVETSILTETDIASDMRKCSDLDLSHFMGISASDTVEYIYYKSTDALSVDELLIIKTGGHNELAPFRDAVDDRIDSQIRTFESYGPDQVAALKSALIVEKGPYILYYVGPEQDKVEEVFTHAI